MKNRDIIAISIYNVVVSDNLYTKGKSKNFKNKNNLKCGFYYQYLLS